MLTVLTVCAIVRFTVDYLRHTERWNMYSESTHIRTTSPNRDTLRRLALALSLRRDKPVSISDALGEVTRDYLERNPDIAAMVRDGEAVQA